MQRKLDFFVTADAHEMSHRGSIFLFFFLELYSGEQKSSGVNSRLVAQQVMLDRPRLMILILLMIVEEETGFNREKSRFKTVNKNFDLSSFIFLLPDIDLCFQ